MAPPTLPIPFPQSSEIYMTAISIVVAIVLQTQIQQFIEHKKRLISKLTALVVAILFVFAASVLIFGLLNILVIFSSLFTPILMIKIGNNIGTYFYVLGTLYFATKLFFGNMNTEKFNFPRKELAVAGIFFILGWILNNFLVTKP